MLHSIVFMMCIAVAFTCSAVVLPAAEAQAVAKTCPGVPKATVTSAPYKYIVSSSERMDYLYVRSNKKCLLLYPGGPSVKCYQLVKNGNTYTVYFSGSAGCGSIDSVAFYTTDCTTPTPTPAPTTVAPTTAAPNCPDSLLVNIDNNLLSNQYVGSNTFNKYFGIAGTAASPTPDSGRGRNVTLPVGTSTQVLVIPHYVIGTASNNNPSNDTKGFNIGVYINWVRTVYDYTVNLGVDAANNAFVRMYDWHPEGSFPKMEYQFGCFNLTVTPLDYSAAGTISDTAQDFDVSAIFDLVKNI